MGGGPRADERAATAAAERRAQEQNDLQRQYIQAASAPDPLEERMRAADMSWLDWSEGKSGPIDVRNAPGLGPSLDLYESAARGQEGEKVGIGALRMGMNASDPNLALKLAEQQKAHREQSAAGGLERAVTMKDAEVKRSVMPLVGLATDRRMGLASLSSGNANTAQGQYIGSILNRPDRPSFWRTFSQSFGNSAGRAAGQAAVYGTGG